MSSSTFLVNWLLKALDADLSSKAKWCFVWVNALKRWLRDRFVVSVGSSTLPRLFTKRVMIVIEIFLELDEPLHIFRIWVNPSMKKKLRSNMTWTKLTLASFCWQFKEQWPLNQWEIMRLPGPQCQLLRRRWSAVTCVCFFLYDRAILLLRPASSIFSEIFTGPLYLLRFYLMPTDFAVNFSYRT